MLLSTQWAFLVSLACVCTQAAHVRIVGQCRYCVYTAICKIIDHLSHSTHTEIAVTYFAYGSHLNRNCK